MDAYEWFPTAAVALGALNTAVSIAIAVGAGYSGRQKLLQILIVWTIPVLGALLLGLFLLTQRGRLPPAGYRSEAKDNAIEVWSAFHSDEWKD